MAFFDFNALSFYSVKMSQRIHWGQDVWEVFFPRLFDFIPGQLCALHCGDPHQARLYSIASGNKDEQLSILFKVFPQGFLTPNLSECDLQSQFYISPPFGNFILQQEKAVWVAVGTGIAPFLCAARSGLDLSRIILIQGARDSQSFWAWQYFESRLKKYVRCCSSQQVKLEEEFYFGRLTKYLNEVNDWDSDTKFYLCGSSQMIVDVREILVLKDVDLSKIICEVYF